MAKQNCRIGVRIELPTKYLDGVDVPVTKLSMVDDLYDEDSVLEYARKHLKGIDRDDWQWAVDVEPIEDVQESVDPDDPAGFLASTPGFTFKATEYGVQVYDAAHQKDDWPQMLGYISEFRGRWFVVGFSPYQLSDTDPLRRQPFPSRETAAQALYDWRKRHGCLDEATDPDDPETNLRKLEARFGVCLSLDVTRADGTKHPLFFTFKPGSLIEVDQHWNETEAAQYSMNLRTATRLLGVLVKSRPDLKFKLVPLVFEARQPFDGLPFPVDPSEVKRFLRSSAKRAERVVL